MTSVTRNNARSGGFERHRLPTGCGACVVHPFARRDRGKARDERMRRVLHDPATCGKAREIYGKRDTGKVFAGPDLEPGIPRCVRDIEPCFIEPVLDCVSIPANRLNDERRPSVVPGEQLAGFQVSEPRAPPVHQPARVCVRFPLLASRLQIEVPQRLVDVTSTPLADSLPCQLHGRRYSSMRRHA